MPKCSLPDKSIILIGFALEIHISPKRLCKTISLPHLVKCKACFLVYLLCILLCVLQGKVNIVFFFYGN